MIIGVVGGVALSSCREPNPSSVHADHAGERLVQRRLRRATDHRPRWEREIAEELYDHASDYANHAAGNDFDADEATNLAPGPDGYVGEPPAAVDDATRRELKRRIYRQYVTAPSELADLERALDGGATGAGALRNWSAPLPPVDAAVPAQLLQPVTADGAKRPICACPVEST